LRHLSQDREPTNTQQQRRGHDASHLKSPTQRQSPTALASMLRQVSHLAGKATLQLCDYHIDVRPDDHGPRQRIVDVTLGAGDIASKHAGFLALNRGFGHEIGAGRSGVPDGEHAKSLLRLGRQ
jgi:hypothetical protein